MDLQQILDQWNQDCSIKQNDLAATSRNTPLLHSKYLQMYSMAKLHLRKAENNQKILLKDKWLYYNGKMDPDSCISRGWPLDPFEGLKVMKGEMDYYYEADSDIQASEDKVHYYKTIVDTLKDILDTLKWRHQTIRNMIEWRRFEEGN